VVDIGITAPPHQAQAAQAL